MTAKELSNWIMANDHTRTTSTSPKHDCRDMLRLIASAIETNLEGGLVHPPEGLEIHRWHGEHYYRIRNTANPGKTIFIDGDECQIIKHTKASNLLADNPERIPKRTLNNLICYHIQFPDGAKRTLYAMPSLFAPGKPLLPLALHRWNPHLDDDYSLVQFNEFPEARFCCALLLDYSKQPAEQERIQGDQKSKTKRTRRKLNRKGGRKPEDGERTKLIRYNFIRSRLE